MKKFILIILPVLIWIALVGCGAKKLNTIKVNTDFKSKEELIKEAVSNFYLKSDAKNNGELIIYNTKTYKNNYLVLAEKYSGDGHRSTNLFIIDDKFSITRWTSGETPISNCFSINKCILDKSTILFGTFNNSKWDPKQDIKIPVQISNIDISFKSGQNIKEDVSNETGYIIALDSITEVQQFNLFNEKNELQSNLDEIGNIYITELNDFKIKL
ncbi:hypothetical protein [Clostridium sp. YIM B02551]|uniref:hypothetical protein n=1 Tax=Clostridium sp. YIM B02551 TaxID=2910679 RepID=UPI001EEB7759|nr:hypothetical protein [Clostridium sp. YIM B02551]